jgi:drug/metabolite transporter (DMT)-like permease
LVFKGIIYAILTAFCFGIMPILTKSLYGETGVDPFFFLMIRYLIAAILMWVYLFFYRNHTWQVINRATFALVLKTSCCYIIVTATYFVALQFIDAAFNSLLFFTFPVFTPFLGLLFFKERLRFINVLAAIVGFLGCLMIIGGYHIKGLSGEAFGIIMGLVSGAAYAVYTLLGQKVTVKLEPLTVITLNVTIIAVFFFMIRGNWFWTVPHSIKVYLIAAIIAIISTILANTFYFKAIKAVGALKAGIFSSFEPLFTAVLAIIFLGERMGLTQWVGALFIFGSMVIVQQPWKSALQ